jgi:unsaturated chondroitin disaccharide hydrolase
MVGLAQAIAKGARDFAPVAERVAKWWIANVPSDYVSYWDFDDPAIPNALRDTSATAIAAATLLKLAKLTPAHASTFKSFAEATIGELATRHLTPLDKRDARKPGMLLNGCFNNRGGVATAHELVWGDYFLLEGLLALDGRIAIEEL